MSDKTGKNNEEAVKLKNSIKRKKPEEDQPDEPNSPFKKIYNQGKKISKKAAEAGRQQMQDISNETSKDSLKDKGSFATNMADMGDQVTGSLFDANKIASMEYQAIMAGGKKVLNKAAEYDKKVGKIINEKVDNLVESVGKRIGGNKRKSSEDNSESNPNKKGSSSNERKENNEVEMSSMGTYKDGKVNEELNNDNQNESELDSRLDLMREPAEGMEMTAVSSPELNLEINDEPEGVKIEESPTSNKYSEKSSKILEDLLEQPAKINSSNPGPSGASAGLKMEAITAVPEVAIPLVAMKTKEELQKTGPQQSSNNTDRSSLNLNKI